MLETIRELALERLANRGRRRRCGARMQRGSSSSHVDPGWRTTPTLPRAAARARDSRGREYPGRDRLGGGGRATRTRRSTLAVELEHYWVTNSPFEGARILTRLLESEGVSSLVLARGLRCLGGCEQIVGDYDAAATAYARSLAGFEQLGDERGVANLLHRQASLACARGDSAQARTLVARWTRSSSAFARHGSRRSSPGHSLTRSRLDGNNASRDSSSISRARRRAGAIGFVWWEAVMTGSAAEVADLLGLASEALRLALRALDLCHEVGDRQNTAWGLATLAAVERDLGNVDRAAVLWGAVEAEERRGRLGPGSSSASRSPRDSRMSRATASSAGIALTLDEAVAYALSVDSG